MALRFGHKLDTFFHIPRTGGNYTIKVCRRLMYVDGTPSSARSVGKAHAGPQDVGYIPQRSFTIIRPPLDWYRSFYRYRIMKHVVVADLPSNPPPAGHPLDQYIWTGQYSQGGHVHSFGEFMLAMYAAYPRGYATELYLRFTPYVDNVLTTSRLTTELPQLLRSWGYLPPFRVPAAKTNATTTPRGKFMPFKRYKALARTDRGTLRGLPTDIDICRHLLLKETANGLWDQHTT